MPTCRIPIPSGPTSGRPGLPSRCDGARQVTGRTGQPRSVGRPSPGPALRLGPRHGPGLRVRLWGCPVALTAYVHSAAKKVRVGRKIGRAFLLRTGRSDPTGCNCQNAVFVFPQKAEYIATTRAQRSCRCGAVPDATDPPPKNGQREGHPSRGPRLKRATRPTPQRVPA